MRRINCRVDNYSYTLLSDLTKTRKNRVDLNKNKGASMLSDTMFKTMFLKESRLDYCAKLLSCFLNRSYEEIRSNISFGKNELSNRKKYQKNQRCDLVLTLDNSILNVEINSNESPYIMERNIEYAYKLYSDVSRSGGRYNYKQVIQININNYAYEGCSKIMDTFALGNRENVLLTDKILIMQLYVPNLYSKDIKELNEKEKCLLAFVEPDTHKARIYAKGDKIMERYVKEREEALIDTGYGESYDKEWAIKDQCRREGIEKGVRKGIKKNSLLVAKNMLKDNVSLNLIAKYTNLTPSQIKSLRG